MRSSNTVLTWSGATTLALGDGTASSDPVYAEMFHLLSVAAVISGSAALNGTLTLQACNDAEYDRNAGKGHAGHTGLTNWVDVNTQAVTADGVTFWDKPDCTWRFFRVKWTRTGGSGTLSARAQLKGW